MSDSVCSHITPSVIESILRPVGISARYVFVLESEGRASDSIKQVPRFTVGGKRANKNPNLVKLEELHEVTLEDYGATDIPSGWSKVHEYIYVLGDDRDNHGWEYRSDWADGEELAEDDEQWQGDYKKANVRRRIWMTSVVKTKYYQRAKQTISEAFQKFGNGNKSQLMMGSLFIQEQGMLGKKWEERECILKPDCIEVYPLRQPNTSTGGVQNRKLLLKINLLDASISCGSVIGLQLPERQNPFFVRERDTGKILGLFDATESSHRKRWIHAINYQVALGSSNVNFPPLPNSPPADRECPDSVLVFGHLHKKGHFAPTWKHRFFQLTPYELQYYDGVIIKGRVPLKGSRIFDDGDPEGTTFSITTADSYVLDMRADTIEHKAMWYSLLERQLDWINGLDARIHERLTGKDKGSKKSNGDQTAAPTEQAQADKSTAGDDNETYSSMDGEISLPAATPTDQVQEPAEGPTDEDDVAGMEGGQEYGTEDPMFRPSEMHTKVIDTLETEDVEEEADEEFGDSDSHVLKLDTKQQEEEAIQGLSEVTRMSVAFEIVGTTSEKVIEKQAPREAVDVSGSDKLGAGGNEGGEKEPAAITTQDASEDDEEYDEDGIGAMLPGPPTRGSRPVRGASAQGADASDLYNQDKLRGVEVEEREEEERVSISDFPELPTHIVQKHGNRRQSRVIQGIARYEKEKGEEKKEI